MSSLHLRELGVKGDAVEDGEVLDLFTASRESVVYVAASQLLPGHVAVTTRNGFIQLIDTATGEYRLFLTYLYRIPLDASLRCLSLVPSLYAASLHHGHGHGHGHGHRQHHFLYSLAYSNELLVANVETGEVRLCAACASRPSVVQCDGDYIVCGEGNGQVTVWRASSEEWVMRCLSSSGASTSPFPYLWRSRLFDSTVVCANVHRDQLVCCSADYRCAIVSLETGVVHATLPLDLNQAVAVFLLPKPSAVSSPDKGLAVCLRSHISVFAAVFSHDTVATEQTLSSPVTAARHSGRWTHLHNCTPGREEVSCASYLGGYLTVGTVSGLVILYSCDAAEWRMKVLVRLNVGYGVMGVQLFSNNTLLVVTSAGDVWRWPLCDLLRSANASGIEGDVDEPMSAELQPPLPLAAPGGPPTRCPLDSTLSPEPRSSATPYELSFTQEGNAEDRNLSVHETSNLGSATQCEGEVNVGRREAAPAVAVSADDAEGTPSVRLSTVSASASVRNTSVSTEGDSDEGFQDVRRVEPATVSCLPLLPPPFASVTVSGKSVGATDSDTLAHCDARQQPRILYDPERSPEEPEVVGVDVLPSTTEDLLGLCHDPSHVDISPTSTNDTTAHYDSVSEDSDAGEPDALAKGPAAGTTAAGTSNRDIHSDSIHSFQTNAVDFSGIVDDAQAGDSSPRLRSRQPADMKGLAEDMEREFERAMGRLLGPAVGVEGLRKNRRMCPRKMTGVLANLTNQQAIAVGSGVAPRGAPSKTVALEGPNSTKLLEAKRATLEAAAFDFEEYRKAHRLKVDALQYQHPVLLPTYTLQDRVFDSVVSADRLCDKDAGGSSGANGRAAGIFLAASEDELRDVTYGKVKWTLDPQIAEERRRGGPDMAQHHCDDLLFSIPHPAKGAVLFAEEEPLMPSRASEGILLLPLPLPPAPSVF